MIDKQTVIDNLLAVAEELQDAELEAVDAEVALLRTREILRQVENGILTSGKIEGKNERVREATLAEMTHMELDEVAVARVNAACAGAALRVQQQRLATWRAVAELLAN